MAECMLTKISESLEKSYSHIPVKYCASRTWYSKIIEPLLKEEVLSLTGQIHVKYYWVLAYAKLTKQSKIIEKFGAASRQCRSFKKLGQLNQKLNKSGEIKK